jgi:RsiW-degrading membrane proteinase PrsW (M82 family)
MASASSPLVCPWSNGHCTLIILKLFYYIYVYSWLLFIISIPSNFDSLWCILSAILLGSMVAVRVLSQLHCGIISLRVQCALPCSLTYSCFGNFLGQICTFPVIETMGMCLILNCKGYEVIAFGLGFIIE